MVHLYNTRKVVTTVQGSMQYWFNPSVLLHYRRLSPAWSVLPPQDSCSCSWPGHWRSRLQLRLGKEFPGRTSLKPMTLQVRHWTVFTLRDQSIGYFMASHHSKIWCGKPNNYGSLDRREIIKKPAFMLCFCWKNGNWFQHIKWFFTSCMFFILNLE